MFSRDKRWSAPDSDQRIRSMKNITPTKHYSSTLHQLCKLIPCTDGKTCAETRCGQTSPNLYSVESCGESSFRSAHSCNWAERRCDNLRHHGAKLGAIRGAVPPSRNTLSHANKDRNSDMMEELFWTISVTFNRSIRNSDRRAATVACLAASSEPSMLSIPPRLPWSLIVWTGPNTVAARLRRRCICDLTCKLSSRRLPLSRKPHTTTTPEHCPCAQGCKPVR